MPPVPIIKNDNTSCIKNFSTTEEKNQNHGLTVHTPKCNVEYPYCSTESNGKQLRGKEYLLVSGRQTGPSEAAVFDTCQNDISWQSGFECTHEKHLCKIRVLTDG